MSEQPVSAMVESAARVLKDAACRLYGPRLVSIALFGSAARGVATPESDLDVLVVADELPKGRMSRAREFERVETEVETALAAKCLPLSPVFKSREEVRRGSPLLWDMTEYVVLLYDKDDFLQHVLEATRERLRQLGARRVVRGNAWYWVLKEDFTPGEVFTI
ncbi:MAG: nucleotidyltransferase domain-containing protein [Chitinivibrionales bacterium]|nr:nucleotidyltransferase domain-containing protein [Chitinivibrionales bacterium]